MVYLPTRSTTYTVAVNRGLTRANYRTVNTKTYRPSTVSERPYRTPMNFAFVEASYRQKRPTTKAPRTISNFLSHENVTNTGEGSRDFSFTTAGFDDDAYPTMISYPVAPEDYCDCITIPDDADFTVDICTDDVKWGAIQIEYSDGTCNEVQFSIDTMYGSCTPADSVEDLDWYAYCAIDFDYSLEDASSASVESSAEDTFQSSASSDEADVATSSVDQSMTFTSGEGSASEEETKTDQRQGASSGQSTPNTVEESAPAASAAQASAANTKRSILERMLTLALVLALSLQ